MTVDEHIEALVERYEAQHAIRWLYLTSTVKDPVELYQRKQNSLRTFRHELASVAERFNFDPTTGRYRRNGLGIPVAIDPRMPVDQIGFV
ncbi:hypothetical protein CH267_00860 [Rhodococcus sp. 06-621-2]|nr:hypothetical protein [Rhodococcus sp. 06-621-2]OZC62124.1 hypothetical protein CH267_00860 [Rhodococcus sp. 06-621-2]